ncbi:heterogeneous nuclear ribonucleoprotein A1-like 2 isoform X1 [Apostichopus japonicus]|uniref:heterogeneous nuclear ribonucleoprotein A1-like 2 isoform X1 n=1 Tax=Stichopus japonicus TaxID=307972 RepID=UPI003AB7489A
MGDRNENEQPRKIFLGGLGPSTDEESLKAYFSNYGEIADCCVIRTSGPDTPKKSRGFGFVTFKEVQCVENVMADRVKGKLTIDDKEVEIKQAMSREDANDNPSVTEKCYKVFVSGVKHLKQETIQNYFSTFGDVKEVIVKNQDGDQRKRPYAFVICDDHEVVDRIVVRKRMTIDGIEVECSKAKPSQRDQRSDGPGGGGRRNNPNGFGGGGRFNGGGGGGNFGDRGGNYEGGDGYYGGGGGGFGGGGNYEGSGFGGGYGGGGGSGGGYGGGGYGGGGSGGYGGGGYGGGGSGGYGGGGGGYGGGGGGGYNSNGGGNFGSGYGSQNSSYGPVRQNSGRYGGGPAGGPYSNYGGGGYGSGGGGGRRF